MGVRSPTISVITPCYNGAKYLRETIESVLAQTYPPLEMIVVDDGSTDDSAAIAESFGPPVRVIRQTNQGESTARNRGIAEARGDYLHFLDADDLLHPEAYAHAATTLNENKRAVILMDCAVFVDGDLNNTLFISRKGRSGWFPAILTDPMGVPFQWIIPKELVIHCGGFDQSIRYGEDWEFLFRIALCDPDLRCVEEVVCYHRAHRGSQTFTGCKRQRALANCLLQKRFVESLRKRPDLLNRYGKDAFWAGWSWLTRAHHFGATWPQLQPLACELETLVREGPRDLRRLRFAQLIRWLGLRRAWWLRRLVHGRADRQALLAQEVQEQQHRVLIGSGATADTTAVPT
jgi:glycosyltransferase involved in cell wall biosynthesis